MYNLHPTNITFGVTNQCTAACTNCSGAFNPNPKKLQFLTAEQMIARIDEALSLGWELPDGICFTGGEALIRRDDVFKTAKYARSKGIYNLSLMSNGSWGKNFKYAKNLAAKIKNSGIGDVCFSTGFDHQKFVDEKSIVNAVHACKMARIYTQIDCETDINNIVYQNLITNKKLKGTIIDKIEWITWKTKEIRNNEPKLIDISRQAGCSFLFSTCYVNFENHVMPCCGQFNNFMSKLDLGINLENWYDRNWLHIWLSVDGAYLLWSLFNKTGTYPYHQCAACLAIQSIPEHYQAVHEAWPQHRDSVIYRYNYMCSLLQSTDKLKKEGKL